MTVRRLLQAKEKGFWAVAPDTSVYDAILVMVEHDIGAVVVLDNDQLVGIVTERDCTRKLIVGEKTARETQIREVMTTRVLYVTPDQTVPDCMALMTNKRIRHLPVLDGDKVVGLVSIRDLVRFVMSEQEFMIEQLEHYITDRPPYMKG